MLRQLKAEIFSKFDNQGDCARALGIDEPRLSRLIRERAQPSEREIKVFAKVFGKKRIESLLGHLLDQRGATIYPGPTKKSPAKD